MISLDRRMSVLSSIRWLSLNRSAITFATAFFPSRFDTRLSEGSIRAAWAASHREVPRAPATPQSRLFRWRADPHSEGRDDAVQRARAASFETDTRTPKTR